MRSAATLNKVEAASKDSMSEKLVSYCEKLSTSLQVLKVTIDKYETYNKKKKDNDGR